MSSTFIVSLKLIKHRYAFMTISESEYKVLYTLHYYILFELNEILLEWNK